MLAHYQIKSVLAGRSLAIPNATELFSRLPFYDERSFHIRQLQRGSERFWALTWMATQVERAPGAGYPVTIVERTGDGVYSVYFDATHSYFINVKLASDQGDLDRGDEGVVELLSVHPRSGAISARLIHRTGATEDDDE